jgi:hypothetical protein
MNPHYLQIFFALIPKASLIVYPAIRIHCKEPYCITGNSEFNRPWRCPRRSGTGCISLHGRSLPSLLPMFSFLPLQAASESVVISKTVITIAFAFFYCGRIAPQKGGKD